MNPPREGLPTCTQIAILDNRAAVLIDTKDCQKQHGGESDSRFWITWGPFVRLIKKSRSHGTMMPQGHPDQLADSLTNDPVEAKAIYARACEWVRTGVLP